MVLSCDSRLSVRPAPYFDNWSSVVISLWTKLGSLTRVRTISCKAHVVRPWGGSFELSRDHETVSDTRLHIHPVVRNIQADDGDSPALLHPCFGVPMCLHVTLNRQLRGARRLWPLRVLRPNAICGSTNPVSFIPSWHPAHGMTQAIYSHCTIAW